MGLGAQAVALGRLHLARALVVAMAMAQHRVENSCRANRARSKRPAVGRKLKNAERGKREGRGWLEEAQMREAKDSNPRNQGDKCAPSNGADHEQNRKEQISVR